MATEKVPTSRIFSIMQYEKNPKTGESLDFGESNILEGLSKKSIKEYAYILHDKDPWSEDAFEAYVEENGEEPEWLVGDPKPRHWHAVIRVSPALTLDQISKWFNVPKQFIDMKKGRGAFLDCVQYLTHETEKQQLLGKWRYPDEEVKASFDFRKELDEREAKRARYGGRDLSSRDQVRYDVLYNGKTIREVIDTDPLAYQNDFATLDKLRAKYITDTAPLPKSRINYYIYAEDGKNGSGIGKGLLSRALARSMYPELTKDDDIFFEVGEKGALFDGYDGQPVIIWNDRRGYQLLDELGGKVGNVYNVFDTTPTSQRQNVKYSSLKLINEVNIVNSVQHYTSFLDGISGADKGVVIEDQNQAKRRFPFIIPMRFEDFDIMINKGFMNDSKEFDQYIKFGNVRANMQRMQMLGAGNEALVQEAEAKLLEPVIEKHKELISKRQPKDVNVTLSDILAGTSFTENKEQKVYYSKEECQNCHSVMNCMSYDKEDDGQYRYVMFCDKCSGDNLPF